MELLCLGEPDLLYRTRQLLQRILFKTEATISSNKNSHAYRFLFDFDSNVIAVTKPLTAHKWKAASLYVDAVG